MDSNFRDQVEGSWIMTVLIWLVMMGLFVALLKLASMNIVPYVWFIKHFGGESNRRWIEYVPVFGTLHSGWVSFVHGIGGFLIWFVVQVLQTLWILIGLDRKAHTNALREARAARVSKDESTPFERKMSRKAQQIPFFFIRWSMLLALGAYAFDLVLGATVFPPASDLQTFLFALGSGMTSQIDGGNVLSLLSMMFSFELLLIPTVAVWQWNQHRKTI